MLRAADAHEIARTILGEQRGDFGGHFASDFVRLADGEAAHGVTGKVEIEKLAGAFAAQVGEGSALHDAELPLPSGIAVPLGGLLKIFAGAARPSGSAPERSFGLFARGGSFNALVEHHGDVRTQRELNLGCFFGSEQMFGAVQMRPEAHAFVGDFAKFGKAEDLVAAGISQDGAGPGHKWMQAAEAANQFMARTQIQMIGVRKDDFGAELLERFLRERFDSGLRADGQKERSLDRAVRRSETAAARAGRVRFQDFKGKRHPLSVSGEDEGPAYATDNIEAPDAEGDSEGLSALQLFGIYRRETNGQQNQRPKNKNIERLA